MLELRILNGVQKGAILPLLEDSVTIGSSDTCDLVIFETEIEPIHLTIHFDGKVCAPIHQHGEVLDITNTVINIGQTLLPNSPFRIGQTWLVYTYSSEEWPDNFSSELKKSEQDGEETLTKVNKTKPSFKQWVLVFLTGLSLTLIALTIVLPADGSYARSTIEIEPSSPELDASEVMQILSKMLEERGLDTMVNLELFDDMNVVINGRLDTPSFGVLKRMLRRFQRTFLTQIQIDEQVTVTEQGLPFEVKTIVVGNTPHVVTNSEDTLFLGDEKEGYRLIDISEDQVIFDGLNRVEVAW